MKQKSLLNFFSKSPSISNSTPTPIRNSTKTKSNGTPKEKIKDKIAQPTKRNLSLNSPVASIKKVRVDTPHDEKENVQQKTPRNGFPKSYTTTEIQEQTPKESTMNSEKKSKIVEDKYPDESDSEPEIVNPISSRIRARRSVSKQNKRKQTRLFNENNGSSEEEWNPNPQNSASESEYDEEHEKVLDAKFIVESSDEEEVVISQAAKKRRRLKSGNGTNRKKEDRTPKQERTSNAKSVNKNTNMPSLFMTPPGKVNTKLKTPGSTSRTPPNSASSFKSPGFKSPKPSTPSNKDIPSGAFGAGNHSHDNYRWLTTSRRDKNMKCKGEDGFNPKTLYIPESFLKKETPAMAQWWEFKSNNMDVVLFFKVGKFYELFHMDADVGFHELNLIYMKGEKAHSGFPEIAYGKMSRILVEKGYRVARIEQTETPEMLKERNRTSKAKSKVVRREVCSILSAGTNTQNVLDQRVQDYMDSEAQPKRFHSATGHLMVIKEMKGKKVPYISCVDEEQEIMKEMNPKEEQYDPYFGVCIGDCTTGAFHLGAFDDSHERVRLRTLIAQFNVVEIVVESKHVSKETTSVLKFFLPRANIIEYNSNDEFMNSTQTVEFLEEKKYFAETSTPRLLLNCLDNPTTTKNKAILSALGGCLYHLNRSLIDHELISLGNFKEYHPLDTPSVSTAISQSELKSSEKVAITNLTQEYMILDAHTIQNLELLQNNYDGKRSGSLLHFLDRTKTAFGHRLFREWILHPLCQPKAIEDRYNAIEDFMKHPQVLENLQQMLKQLPDLQRITARIYAMGLNTTKSKDHPNQRAVMYEAKIYNVRKIKEFIAALNGFEQSLAFMKSIQQESYSFESTLLQSLLSLETMKTADRSSSICFPDMTQDLTYFQQAFDHEYAKIHGCIVPQSGVDSDYDQACLEINRIDKEFTKYLNEQKRRLNCSSLSYWGTKKEDRYQIEVPEKVLSCNQPDEYELKSKKKGFRRFHTATIRTLLKELIQAEELRENALKDQMRRIFHRFGEKYEQWIQVIECLSILDCLSSLTITSQNDGQYIRPKILDSASTQNQCIEIEQGIHPCVAASLKGKDFIPNDIQLGTIKTNSRMLLLTGPNMGGKSTLLRQTCLLVLMAQVGCFVPATKCEFTLVDRIFTRLGACDRILSGQSTFYVELSETSTILHHATNHSLVILDELGRGTSTFDGTAIASAVVEYLAFTIQCRTLFATHYHSLVEEYKQNKQITLGYMNCLVDTTSCENSEENEKAVKNEQEEVTFLYTLQDGICPRSYGINVARLAHLPDEVIQLAQMKSSEFEQVLQQSHQSIQNESDDDNETQIKKNYEHLYELLIECQEKGPQNYGKLRNFWSSLQE